MELHKKVRKYIETKESKHSKPSKESCLPPDFNWESYEKKNRNKYTYHNNNYLTLKEQKRSSINKKKILQVQRSSIIKYPIYND